MSKTSKLKIDIYAKKRLTFARKLLKDDELLIETLAARGKLLSVNKFEDVSTGTELYKALIFHSNVKIPGKGATKLLAIEDALKHMESQGSTIRNYMK